MPDQISENFERALEQDIERLSAEVKMHQERPEMKGASGREIVKQSIQSMTQNPMATPPEGVFQNPLPDYAANAPSEAKLEIEHLLETAFRKGIGKANEEASKSNPFILDAFHDALAGKLYPELKKRGIVE